jgi:hypothetical protein
MKLSYFKLSNCWHFIYAFDLFLRSGGAERRPAHVCANIVFYVACVFLCDFRKNCIFGQEKSPTGNA